MSYKKDKGDISWRLVGKKKHVAYSTVAARDLIIAVAHKMPDATLLELYEAINYDMESKAVLTAFIKKGYGDITVKKFFG